MIFSVNNKLDLVSQVSLKSQFRLGRLGLEDAGFIKRKVLGPGGA